MPAILRVVLNENWQAIILFDESGFGLFDASIARKKKEYSFLAYPQKLKNLTYEIPRRKVWDA